MSFVKNIFLVFLLITKYLCSCLLLIIVCLLHSSCIFERNATFFGVSLLLYLANLTDSSIGIIVNTIFFLIGVVINAKSKTFAIYIILTLISYSY